MRQPHPDTTTDVPYIGLKSVLVLHGLLILFIALVHWKLTTLTSF